LKLSRVGARRALGWLLNHPQQADVGGKLGWGGRLQQIRSHPDGQKDEGSGEQESGCARPADAELHGEL